MVADEDLSGILGRSTKNGTRPLRIVTMTQEMDSWIDWDIHVENIICTTSLLVSVTTISILLLLNCVAIAEAEIQEFARTRTTEPRTVAENLV